MDRVSEHTYKFGPFELDTIERQLRREGQVVPLTPKALDVLVILVRNSQHVLRKEELLAEVWKDSVVEEKNLADNVSLLRKALSDDPKQHRYIETVPRYGYRFVANVDRVNENKSEVLVTEHVRAQLLIEEDEPAQAMRLGGILRCARRQGVHVRRDKGCRKGGPSSYRLRESRSLL